MTNYTKFNVITLLLFFVSMQSQTLTKIKQEPKNNDFGSVEEKINNFTGRIYHLNKNTRKLPNFDTIKPVGLIYTEELSIKRQAFNKGFPGVTNRFEYFGIDYQAHFYVKESGVYCFLLGSDDGSKLFIDNKLVIDNDGAHPLVYKNECVKMLKGMHAIRVQYFQGPRMDVALTLKCKKVDEKTFEAFKLSDFSPITVTNNSNVIDISVADDILFNHDSFELSKDAKYTLSEIKRVILDKTTVKKIIINGHTDNVGDEKYNLKLSLNRANAVKNYLISNGLSLEFIECNGLGESVPVALNDIEENKRKNRRIEIKILK